MLLTLKLTEKVFVKVCSVRGSAFVGKHTVLLRKSVEVISIVRRMRGGSQSFLVRGSDGCAYVCKFTANPQGNRTLINECIASHLLSALHVATPDLAVLRLTDSCKGREQLYFSTDRREPIRNGLHLGSKCPVDPNTTAIFDFLPRQLYPRVSNLHDAGIVFAFDCWARHVDTRQFVYARSRRNAVPTASRPSGKVSLTAWAIDNGKCFGGDWNLAKILLHAYPPFEIYSHCNLEESALTGAKLIQDLPSSVIQSSHQQIPRDWFTDDDQEALALMLDTLQRRQSRLFADVCDHLSAVKYMFRRTG